jgi:hypothetical protein
MNDSLFIFMTFLLLRFQSELYPHIVILIEGEN